LLVPTSFEGHVIWERNSPGLLSQAVQVAASRRLQAAPGSELCRLARAGRTRAIEHAVVRVVDAVVRIRRSAASGGGRDGAVVAVRRVDGDARLARGAAVGGDPRVDEGVRATAHAERVEPEVTQGVRDGWCTDFVGDRRRPRDRRSRKNF